MKPKMKLRKPQIRTNAAKLTLRCKTALLHESGSDNDSMEGQDYDVNMSRQLKGVVE